MDNYKKDLRREILQKRKHISKTEIQDKSNVIIDKIYEIKEYKKSRVIMCYMDYQNEVRTGDFIRKSLHLGKKVALPRLTKNNYGNLEIRAIYIENIINDLEKGNYSIMEPRAYIENEASHDEIDMAIVPGIAFDRERNRIGYGKGYYDEFFSRYNNSIIKVGIGYDFQVIDFFNPNSNDIPMNLVITEKRIL